ncbi:MULTISPECIES: hypothetical protein [Pseudomonas]|uniref:Uncharacterized protein n=1 Tax=Pseudomonas soli TaxID=1306993 RepID=A0A2V4I717_9PSED|nr:MULTISPECIES: hypothetical protein [Pseudomonas]PYB85045.1 hypothetical protein DMX07_03340 [Pseudomonas soli]PZW86577.1 hypothetical protein DFS21_101334 [Pseudomonas sp. 2848]
MAGSTEVTGTLALPDLVVDLRDDGKGNAELLPVERQGQALTVKVPWWEFISEGNVIALIWDGENLEGVAGAFHVVKEEEANPPIEPGADFTLAIPSSYWDGVAEGEDGRFLLGYGARREQSDHWDLANSFYVRIDRQAPGGSEGALGKVVFPADVEERGHILESDFVGGKLTISVSGYDGRQLGDQITLTITDGVKSVTEGPFKVESETDPTEVTISLTNLQALFDSIPIRFTYQVQDLTGNESVVSLAHDSLTLRLTQTLAAPRVEGVNGRDELDFNALGEAPVKVIVTPDPAWLGKTLQLLWAGSTANGSSLPPVFDGIEKLEADDLEEDLAFTLDNSHAAQALQGSATVLYRISGAPWRTSDACTVKVTGTFVLEAPEIVEAPGQWLDPEQLPEQVATLRVLPGKHIKVGDQLELKWHGLDAEGNPVDDQWPLDVKDDGPFDHSVGKDKVEALRGGSLELGYILTSKGGAISPSPLPWPCWRVPNVLRRPEVEKAFGDDKDQLNFHRDFIDATHVKVSVAYTGMNEDQEAAVRWAAEEEESGVWARVVRWARKWILKRTDFTYQSPWKRVAAPDALVFEVPIGVLMAFIGKTVSVSYLVKPAGGGEEQPSDVLVLNVLAQDRDDLQAPQYMSFGGDAPKFSLRYDRIKAQDKVDIHWQAEGAEPRRAIVEVYQEGRYFLILVDKSWAEADRRRTVFANYSFLVDANKPETRQFSPASSFQPD